MPRPAGEFELRDYLDLLRRRWWIIVGATAVVVLAALFVTSAQEPVYESTATVIVPAAAEPAAPTRGGRPDAAGGRSIENEVLFVRSEELRTRVAGALDVEQAPKVLVAPLREGDAFTVTARHRRAARAAEIANAYAEQYLAQRREREAALDAAVNAELQRQSDAVQQELTAVTAQLVALDERRTQAARGQDAAGDAAAVSAARAEAQATVARIEADALQRQADQAVRDEAPDAPARQAAADQARARAGEAERVAAEARGRAVASRTAPVPTADATATTLESRRRVLEQQQQVYVEQINGRRIAAATAADSARILTPAVASRSPLSPTPERNLLLGLAVGLTLGIALAFLREHLDTRVHRREDVAHVVPVLATIPRLARRRSRPELVAMRAGRGAEAVRSLRTAVQLAGLGDDVRTVQVSGPTRDQGATTTAANLAASLASAGQRVVLVDGDLAVPRLASVFGVAAGPGLAEVLAGDATLASALRPLADQPGLSLLTAGSTDRASELLAMPGRWDDVRSSLLAGADVVVVDGPPILVSADAGVLAAAADLVLIVMGAGTTTLDDVERSMGLLARARVPEVGAVLNRAGRAVAEDRRRGPRAGATERTAVVARPVPAT